MSVMSANPGSLSSSVSEAERYWEKASAPRLALLSADIARLPAQCGDIPRCQLESRREAERNAVKRVLCKLDSSWNEVQPVNSLPSDVLTQIFLTVMMSSSQPSDGSLWSAGFMSDRSFTPRWLGLLRVCKRWRSEALACPSLWSHLGTSMSTTLLALSVQRSQDASLILRTECKRHKRATDRLDILFAPDALDRAKELYLEYGCLGSEPHVYLDRLARLMPRLESLVYRHNTTRGSISNTAPLESFFRNSFAPRLSRLILETIPTIPPPSHVFSNLRVFCLRTPQDKEFTHPPSARLFELLATMPHIERLELRHTLPAEPYTPYRAAPLSRLHLRRLVLEGPILACICMLRGLRLSSHCSISIDCDASGVPIDAFPSLMDALVGAGIKHITPRSLSALSDSKGSLHVIAFNQRLALDLMRDEVITKLPTKPTPPLNINMRSLSVEDNSVIPTFIASLCQHLLLLERLEILSISVTMDEYYITGGPTASSELRDLWRTVLGLCPMLREVCCACAPAYALLRELAVVHDMAPLLPALETLVFDENFVSRHFLYEGESLYDLLLHALQRRSIPRVQIREEQPFTNTEDLIALEQFTTLERIYDDYGPTPYISNPPSHFFGFGPDWPHVLDMDIDDAEMVEEQDAEDEDAGLDEA